MIDERLRPWASGFGSFGGCSIPCHTSISLLPNEQSLCNHDPVPTTLAQPRSLCTTLISERAALLGAQARPSIVTSRLCMSCLDALLCQSLSGVPGACLETCPGPHQAASQEHAPRRRPETEFDANGSIWRAKSTLTRATRPLEACRSRALYTRLLSPSGALTRAQTPKVYHDWRSPGYHRAGHSKLSRAPEPGLDARLGLAQISL